jgi:hypothetical protein
MKTLPITLEQLNNNIQQDNEAFNKLSKSEKRVQIAKDVLDRIEIKQLTLKQGKILNLIDFRSYEYDVSLKEVLNTQKVECTVCAKGGLFMGYVGRTNDFQVGSMDGDPSMTTSEMFKLRELFTQKQLNTIEYVFEGSPYEGRFTTREATRAVAMCRKYNDSTERMQAICENIIRNKGAFKL